MQQDMLWCSVTIRQGVQPWTPCQGIESGEDYFSNVDLTIVYNFKTIHVQPLIV